MLKPVLGHGVLTVKVTVHRRCCTVPKEGGIDCWSQSFVHLSATPEIDHLPFVLQGCKGNFLSWVDLGTNAIVL